MSIKPLYVVLGIVAIVLLWLAAAYNGFVSSEQGVKSAWSQVEATYQRRMDLISNVVATVKGSSEFEKSTLTAVTEARTKWLGAGSINDKIAAAQNIDSALSRLLVTVEAYPQIQSTQAYRDLITELEGTENRINVARQDFNAAVQDYNVKVLRFPGNVFARIFGFKEYEFFKAQDGAQQAPKVDFTK